MWRRCRNRPAEFDARRNPFARIGLGPRPSTTRTSRRPILDGWEWFALTRWLYVRCRLGNERPVVLFDHAPARLVDAEILLPGVSTRAGRSASSPSWLVFTGVALATGLFCSFTSFFIGQSFFSSVQVHAFKGDAREVVSTVDFSGGGLYLAVSSLLAFGLAAMLRHTAGAVRCCS